MASGQVAASPPSTNVPKRLGGRYPAQVAPVAPLGGGNPVVPRPSGAAPAPSPGNTPQRLGRRYPAPAPATRFAPREPPGFHVSVVSPRPSPVHPKIGRGRMSRGQDNTGATLGADADALGSSTR